MSIEYGCDYFHLRLPGIRFACNATAACIMKYKWLLRYKYVGIALKERQYTFDDIRTFS